MVGLHLGVGRARTGCSTRSGRWRCGSACAASSAACRCARRWRSSRSSALACTIKATSYALLPAARVRRRAGPRSRGGRGALRAASRSAGGGRPSPLVLTLGVLVLVVARRATRPRPRRSLSRPRRCRERHELARARLLPVAVLPAAAAGPAALRHPGDPGRLSRCCGSGSCSGWGAFGWLEVKFPPWVYRVLGAADGGRRRRRGWRRWCARGGASTCASPAFLVLACGALLAGLHWTDYHQLEAGIGFMQGRYMFPLDRHLRPRARRRRLAAARARGAASRVGATRRRRCSSSTCSASASCWSGSMRSAALAFAGRRSPSASPASSSLGLTRARASSTRSASRPPRPVARLDARQRACQAPVQLPDGTTFDRVAFTPRTSAQPGPAAARRGARRRHAAGGWRRPAGRRLRRRRSARRREHVVEVGRVETARPLQLCLVNEGARPSR